MRDAATIWANCLEYLKANVEPKPYRTWFEPLQAVSLEGSTLTLLVPAPVYYEYIEEHFIDQLGAALRKYVGTNVNLEYQVPKIVRDMTDRVPQNPQGKKPKQPEPPPTAQNVVKNPFVIPGIKKQKIENQFTPNYRFDNYIEGECNRMARSAGMAISRKPGETGFNPLMIYGPTGVGKTHLVHAIGNAAAEMYPDKNMLYVTMHIFMNQLVYHIKENTVNDFINFYNSLDVLIVDDIQFLDKKQRMQEIFFTIFNHLHQSRKQIILTSDKSPRDMEGIEERLITRFRWGLIADMGDPDLETRMAIMMSYMEREGVSASAEILEYLCYHISNLRGIVGAVNRMSAFVQFDKRDLDMKAAKEIVQNYVTTEVKTEITIDVVMTMVSEHFKTTNELIKSKTRKREVVEARQLAMHISKKLIPTKSLVAIGEAFGGRDHTTVIYSCKTVENLISTDTNYRKTVEDLERKIKLSVG
jgi:chromosomal replication initiator protein